MPAIRKQSSSQLAPVPIINSREQLSEDNLFETSIKNHAPVSEDDLFEEKAVQVSSASRVRTINHNLTTADSTRKRLFANVVATVNDENKNPSRGNAKKRASMERSELEPAEFGKTSSLIELIQPESKIAAQLEQPPAEQLGQKLAATPLISTLIATASPKAAHRRTPLTVQEKLRQAPAAKPKPKPASPPIDILEDFQTLPRVRRKISLEPQELGNADFLSTPAPAKNETPVTTTSTSATRRGTQTRRSSSTTRTSRRKISLGAAAKKPLLSQEELINIVDDEPEEIVDIMENSMETETEVKAKAKAPIVEKCTETPTVPTVVATTAIEAAPEPPAEMKQTSIDTTPPHKPTAKEPLLIRIPPPPPMETLSLIDTAVLTEFKDSEKPFISESDRVDIESFLDSFTSPDLTKFLIPVSIIGEGTFSTVYKVIDLNYYDCDNSKWAPFSRQNRLDYLRLWRWFFAHKETVAEELVLFQNGKPVEHRTPAKTQGGTSLYMLIRSFFYDWAWRGLNALSKEIAIDKLDPSLLPALLQSKMYQFRPHFIALKRINATSSPQRILDEMSFLRELGGKDNIVPLISGFRCEDQIVVTFPYFYSEDFRDFLSNNATFNIKNIASYMKSLFIALAHMHNHRVIHRDVKPSNFLYSNDEKEGARAVLVDFGLAQKCAFRPAQNGASLVKQPTPTLPVQMSQRQVEKERKKLHAVDSLLNSFSQTVDFANVYDRTERVNTLMNNLGPGHFQNDPRVQMKASRAGTRGFRAPEVLFKYANQSTALDIWSAGVILLTLLTRRYPFFQSSDDLDAILEIACIFGQEEMAAAAKLYGRKWVCSVPSVPEHHITWPELCARLNPSFAPEVPPECFDLLASCLHLNADRRITAKHALNHPFIKKYAI